MCQYGFGFVFVLDPKRKKKICFCFTLVLAEEKESCNSSRVRYKWRQNSRSSYFHTPNLKGLYFWICYRKDHSWQFSIPGFYLPSFSFFFFFCRRIYLPTTFYQLHSIQYGPCFVNPFCNLPQFQG